MLSVKGGTQTWSKATQQVDFANDNRKTLSADEQSKVFGDQPIGEVLNKVADPNWVDPAKQVRKVGEQALDKDAFMKLLLTQMKNQDPTSPMQSHEMAAQLAQFTSLEKLTNINDGISALQKGQEPTHNFEALGLIGKAVSGDSSRIDRLNEGDSHGISFDLPQDSVKTILQIKNADGEVVRTLEASNLKAGKNEVTWNGKSEDGRDMQRGTYTVGVEARNSNGIKLAVNTKFAGVISGVNFTAQGPVLMIGKQQIALKDVKEIVDPALLRQSELQAPPAPLGAAKEGSSKNAAAQPTTKTAGNIDTLNMNRAMINALNKSGVKAGI